MHRYLVVAAFLMLTGCEHAGPLEPEGGLQPTLESIQTNIFNTSCALSGCHTGAGAQRGLDLSEGAARENLVGVASQERPNIQRVNPGNPDASYLVMKIEGAPDIVGQRMPLNGTPLSGEEIGVIREWIAGGAE